MDKKMRFKPASFIEVDDLYGGRKIVMVGADGITFWDSMDAASVTPIVIHPIFKPVEIGPIIAFAKRNDLLDALRNLAAYIDFKQDGRAKRDPLYVMRALVEYSKDICDGSTQAFDKALFAANEQEKRALGAQAIYETYADALEQDCHAH